MFKYLFSYLFFVITISCFCFYNNTMAQTLTPTPVSDATPTPVSDATPTPTPTTAGSIFGTVTDELGNPLDEALVSLKSKTSNLKIVYTTGPDGKYVFTDLVAGSYKLSAKKKGYKKDKETVALAEGENKQVDLQLAEKNSNSNGNGNKNNNGNGNDNDNMNYNENENENENDNMNANNNSN